MGIDKEISLITAVAEMRRRAEERLSERTSEFTPPRTEGSRRRLDHELEVHQIELEMQNAQLLQTQEELELSRNTYAELYDFAPIAYFIFDADGVIREVNLTGAQLLGIERGVLVNNPFNSFIAEADERRIFSSHLETVLQGEGNHRCDLRLTGNDGTLIYGQLKSVSLDNVGSKNGHILCSIADGTVGKLLAEELQTAHDKLEIIVHERTLELTRANLRLTQEIDERKGAEKSLQSAYAEIKRLKDRLQAENMYLQQEVARQHNFGELIGQSESLTQVFSLVEQVAPMNATVLIHGETGTGKGVVARAIHCSSLRKDRPMITVNCTALPANLIESELFGREKGAFTGANVRQIGRFELADRGTIFLDEIGEMPMELQCKLLRVIQDGEFERLGSPRTIKVDVRIIAASNRNLEDEIKNGTFREDLFYRLNVFPITLPPLRQRKEDIPLLVSHFIAKFNKKIGKRIDTLPTDTLNALQDYHWPGNVRELESVIERAVITSQGSALQVLDRFDTFAKTEQELAGQDIKGLAELEHDHIHQVLQKTAWRIEGKNGAALILGLNPSTLRARMRKYGIARQ